MSIYLVLGIYDFAKRFIILVSLTIYELFKELFLKSKNVWSIAVMLTVIYEVLCLVFSVIIMDRNQNCRDYSLTGVS